MGELSSNSCIIAIQGVMIVVCIMEAHSPQHVVAAATSRASRQAEILFYNSLVTSTGQSCFGSSTNLATRGITHADIFNVLRWLSKGLHFPPLMQDACSPSHVNMTQRV